MNKYLKKLLIATALSSINLTYAMESKSSSQEENYNQHLPVVTSHINREELSEKRKNFDVNKVDYNNSMDRGLILERINYGLLTPKQLQSIPFDALFKDHETSNLTQEELSALIKLWPDSQSFPTKYMEALEKAADEGDAHAQYNLALVYRHAKDDEKALEWLNKSAAHGVIEAQALLGEIYKTGTNGVEKDETISRSWYEKAADKGHPVAQYNMGLLIQYKDCKGLDLPQKLEKLKIAFSWYKKAAKQGEQTAELQLGNLYKEGDIWGVIEKGRIVKKPKYKKAGMWYLKGIRKSNVVALARFKSIFQIVKDAPTDKEQTLENLEEYKSVENILYNLKDYYIYLGTLSEGRFRGNFGQNDVLTKYCKRVLKRLNNYEMLFDRDLSEPGCLITCIEPNQQQGAGLKKDIIRDLGVQVPDSGSFWSFISNKNIKQIIDDNLFKVIEELKEITYQSFLLLDGMDGKKAELVSEVEKLKASKPEIANHLSSLLKAYFDIKDPKSAEEEYSRIKEFSNKLDTAVGQHIALREDLNKQIYALIKKTIPYRNNLFMQAYPALFQQSK